MDGLGLEGLTTEAIGAQLGGKNAEKLREQAENNVTRQRLAANMRGQPSSSAAAAPKAPAAKPKPKEEDKSLKELNSAIRKVNRYLNDRELAPKLQGIFPPKTGTLAEWNVVLDQIRDRLSEGLSSAGVGFLYLQMVQIASGFVTHPQAPDLVRLEGRPENYCAQQMGRFRQEFAELAVEFGDYFRSGPLMRIVSGTIKLGYEYRGLCNAGVINPEIGTLPEIPPQQSAQQSAPIGVPAEAPREEPEESFPMPPQTFVPRRADLDGGFIELEGGERKAIDAFFDKTMGPRDGYPTCSSSETIPIKAEPKVEPKVEPKGLGFDVPKPVTAKKSTRGRR
jgi:hypothetical protein